MQGPLFLKIEGLLSLLSGPASTNAKEASKWSFLTCFIIIYVSCSLDTNFIGNDSVSRPWNIVRLSLFHVACADIEPSTDML